MNMLFPSRESGGIHSGCYPPGTRVVLNNMNDPYAPVEPGTRGALFGMWTMPVRSALPGTMDAAFH